MLERSTTLHRQPLISPLCLECTPSEEALIIANTNIFAANGFQLNIDENSPPGRKIKVLTLPYSKTVQFDHNDIHDLASLIESVDHLNRGGNFNLADSCSESIPNLVIKNCNLIGREKASQTIKLPKLVSILASRACRSSIMIGSALSTAEMRSIVDNLGKIEQPWNCPHGRPTLRHLVDVRRIPRNAKGLT